jgi:hypothetical protein
MTVEVEEPRGDEVLDRTVGTENLESVSQENTLSISEDDLVSDSVDGIDLL